MLIFALIKATAPFTMQGSAAKSTIRVVMTRNNNSFYVNGY